MASNTPTDAPPKSTRDSSARSKTPQATRSPQSPLKPRHTALRVTVTQRQLDEIINAAAATQNQQVLDVLQKELPRSVIVIDKPPREPPSPPPPDATLLKCVADLEAKAIALAADANEWRTRAIPLLRQHVTATYKKAYGPLLADPIPPPSVDNNSANIINTNNNSSTGSTQTTVTASAKSPSYPRVEKSTVRLRGVADDMLKLAKQVDDTDRRAKNLRTVLEGLGTDAAGNIDADVSQTIDAEWTMMMEDVRSSRKRKHRVNRHASPIPLRHRRRNDDDEEGLVSPFVTPRSKVRRRVARSCYDVPTLQLHMPR